MWVESIVFLPEPFRFKVHLFNVPEQMGVQYVFPTCPVEPFYISVLVGLSRLDVLYHNVLHFTKVDKHPGEELRAVVHPYGHGLAIYLYGLLYVFHHAGGRGFGTRPDRISLDFSRLICFYMPDYQYYKKVNVKEN